MASYTEDKHPEFVIVVWHDAWASGSDMVSLLEHDTHHRPTVMQTLGWLVGDDEVGISLFTERCLDKGEETYRSRTFIPRAMIVSVTPMKLTAPRKRTIKPIDKSA